jgi:hypothetical protein
LIHDRENAHRKLVEALDLKSQAYRSSELKGLPDKGNPLERVNRIHYYIKQFFRAHTSFDRSKTKHLLDLFSFIMNPPHDKLKKVDILLNLGLSCSQNIRFRETFLQKKPDFKV